MDFSTPSRIAEVNKHLRLDRLMNSRLLALKESGIDSVKWEEDYWQIQYLRDEWKRCLMKDSGDYLELSYKRIYEHFCNNYGLTSKEHLEHYGFKKKPYLNNGGCFENNLMLILGRAAKESRANNWSWRLMEEFRHATALNHYMIFNTLTISDEHKDDFWAKGSKHFKNYIHKINRLVDGHRYFAVTEQGKRGRNHFHIIHFFRRPKIAFGDPNYGKKVPYRKQVEEFRTAWPWGFSAPETIRINGRDAWGRAGWRWAVDRNTLQPEKNTNTEALSRYLGKYITKTLTTNPETPWRIKASRNLGLTRIKTVIRKLSIRTLAKLQMIQGTDLIKYKGVMIPTAILKRLTLKRLNALLCSRKSYRRLIATRSTGIPLLSRIKSLILKTRDYSQQNVGNSNNLSADFISNLFPNSIYTDTGVIAALDELRSHIPKLDQELPCLAAAGANEK